MSADVQAVAQRITKDLLAQRITKELLDRAVGNGARLPSEEEAKQVERLVMQVLWRERSDEAKTARLVARAHSLASLVSEEAGFFPGAWNASALTPVLASTTAAADRLDMAHFHPTTPEARSPVLPTLFMPGFPKSATSWLYKCLLDAFSPAAVGCGGRAAGWTSRKCGRRFAVTALQSSAAGQFFEKKELFYFGGVRPDFQFRYDPDLLNLHGPDPTGADLISLPPLWPWERQREASQVLRARLRAMCRVAPPSQGCKLEQANNWSRPCLQESNCSASCKQPPRCSNLGTYACEAPHVENHPRLRGICRGLGSSRALPSSGCGHPACVRVAPATPQFSGQFRSCLWSDAFARQDRARGRAGHLSPPTPPREAFCAHSLLPWGRAGELNLSVVDFTPNYICDADAVRRQHEGAAGLPDRMRFIVVMRDPIMRAFSEWAMFSLGWNWDPIKNFTASMAYKLHDLRKCNRTLYMRPDRLKALPTEEIAAYMRSCFNYGAATMYATTSMYAVCMVHALRYFKREQFLVLRYEDLMQMDGPAILNALARFTGLHLNPRQLNNPKCQPARASRSKKDKRGPNSYSSNSPCAKARRETQTPREPAPSQARPRPIPGPSRKHPRPIPDPSRTQASPSA